MTPRVRRWAAYLAGALLGAADAALWFCEWEVTAVVLDVVLDAVRRWRWEGEGEQAREEANVIIPTVGRVVHFFPERTVDLGMIFDVGQPVTALVCKVLSDRLVHLAAFDAMGRHFPCLNVQLVQEGDLAPAGRHARWMAYQEQKAKTEAAGTQTAYERIVAEEA